MSSVPLLPRCSVPLSACFDLGMEGWDIWIKNSMVPLSRQEGLETFYSVRVWDTPQRRSMRSFSPVAPFDRLWLNPIYAGTPSTAQTSAQAPIPLTEDHIRRHENNSKNLCAESSGARRNILKRPETCEGKECVRWAGGSTFTQIDDQQHVQWTFQCRLTFDTWKPETWYLWKARINFTIADCQAGFERRAQNNHNINNNQTWRSKLGIGVGQD